MRRYLFGFYKNGNMRFISHLDLQRLFKRCIKKAGIKPAYSQGFNPHEKINIVLPLSLGFETERDYFELDSEIEYEPQFLLDGMNSALPEGIKFTFCKEIPFAYKNASSFVQYSDYSIFLPSSHNLDIDAFIIKEPITIFKRDKKTKKTVEKELDKSWIRLVEKEFENEEGTGLHMILRSASNETLNPVNLCESLCRFCNQPFDKEGLRAMRHDIYGLKDGELISASVMFCGE